MSIKIKNNSSSLLAVGLSAVDVTATVASGEGSLFPTLSVGEYFYATLENSIGSIEIVKVTARTSDAMTIVRAQEGTTAQIWAGGDVIDLRITAQTLLDVAQLYVSGTSAVDLTFTGTGRRIKGEMSSATKANNLSLQTSTVNGNTNTQVIPNGTSTSANISVYNSADPDNASKLELLCSAGGTFIATGANGTGITHPLALSAGGGSIVIGTLGELAINASDGTAGQVLTSAGTGAPAAWASLPPTVAVSAYKSTTQSLSSTASKVLFQTEVFDVGAYYTSSTFTPLVAGYYQVNWQVQHGSGVATQLITELYKNGVSYAWGTYNATTSVDPLSGGSSLVYMNGTDYLEVFARSSVTGNCGTGSTKTSFQAVLVSV